jgi:hypothetical protein
VQSGATRRVEIDEQGACRASGAIDAAQFQQNFRAGDVNLLTRRTKPAVQRRRECP